jgi:hypothetical protein
VGSRLVGFSELSESVWCASGRLGLDDSDVDNLCPSLSQCHAGNIGGQHVIEDLSVAVPLRVAAHLDFNLEGQTGEQQVDVQVGHGEVVSVLVGWTDEQGITHDNVASTERAVVYPGQRGRSRVDGRERLQFAFFVDVEARWRAFEGDDL